MALWFGGSATAAPGHFHVADMEIRTAPAQKPVEQQPKVRKVTMNVSAYTVEEGNGDGLTASGVVGTPFLTCAADDLSFGTRIRINGRIWVVQDRFGGGYSNRLDLLMGTQEQCFDFGRQYIEVEILD